MAFNWDSLLETGGTVLDIFDRFFGKDTSKTTNKLNWEDIQKLIDMSAQANRVGQQDLFTSWDYVTQPDGSVKMVQSPISEGAAKARDRLEWRLGGGGFDPYEMSDQFNAIADANSADMMARRGLLNANNAPDFSNRTYDWGDRPNRSEVFDRNYTPDMSVPSSTAQSGGGGVSDIEDAFNARQQARYEIKHGEKTDPMSRYTDPMDFGNRLAPGGYRPGDIYKALDRRTGTINPDDPSWLKEFGIDNGDKIGRVLGMLLPVWGGGSAGAWAGGLAQDAYYNRNAMQSPSTRVASEFETNLNNRINDNDPRTWGAQQSPTQTFRNSPYDGGRFNQGYGGYGGYGGGGWSYTGTHIKSHK